MNEKITKLIQKGVRIPNPSSVYLDDSIDLDRISGKGTVIFPGCRLLGKSTLILDHVKLGHDGPVTIDDCMLGPKVELKGGCFRKSVFLEKAAAGFGAQVREGTIMEEEASIAHTVGLKQTILFPFVTLGSLINFCDCLMAGGTGRHNHSEVGSSFIHFNFTPNQDKATPSLFGDVPGGVMLNQPPIFLGGQGGVVGPCRLAFGTVTAAGTIVRKDEFQPGRLIFGGTGRGGSIAFTSGVYQAIQRIVVSNIVYVANLIALKQWYRQIRSRFISEQFPLELLNGLISVLDLGLEERVKRLDGLTQKVFDSIGILRKTDNTSALLLQQKAFVENWPHIKEIIQESCSVTPTASLLEPFSERINAGIQLYGRKYIDVIQNLQPEEAVMGQDWLQSIINELTSRVSGQLPTYRFFHDSDSAK